MEKRSLIVDCAGRLTDARIYLQSKLRTEEDRAIRNALFKAFYYTSLALVEISKIDFLTDGGYNKSD
jgi:hypothetical protein